MVIVGLFFRGVYRILLNEDIFFVGRRFCAGEFRVGIGFEE